MNMMLAGVFLALSKRSRTRDAPTPTYISTKSEPEIVFAHQVDIRHHLGLVDEALTHKADDLRLHADQPQHALYERVRLPLVAVTLQVEVGQRGLDGDVGRAASGAN